MDITKLLAFSAQQGAADLHPSAVKTIVCVIDVFPAAEKAMVSSMRSESLQAVISQILLKKSGSRGRGARNHARHVGNPKSHSRRRSRADVFSH